MDKNKPWYQSSSYTQDPNAKLSEDVLQQREAVAEKIRGRLKDTSFAKADTDYLLAEFSKNKDLQRTYVADIIRTLDKRFNNNAQWQEYVNNNTDQIYESKTNDILGMVKAVSISDDNVYNAVGHAITKNAKSADDLLGSFSNPEKIAKTAGVEFNSIDDLRQKIDTDKASFDKMLTASINSLDSFLESKDIPSFKYSSPQAYAHIATAYTKYGEKAVERLTNLYQSGQGEYRERLTKKIVEEYGPEILNTKDFFGYTDESGQEVPGLKVQSYKAPESPYSTKFTRSLGKYSDYDQPSEQPTPLESLLDKNGGIDNYDANREKVASDIARQLVRGDGSIGLTPADLVQTLANYSLQTNGVPTDQIERPDSSELVYKFNLNEAPKSIQLAYDILSSRSELSTELRAYGGGEVGVTPNRMERLSKDKDTSLMSAIFGASQPEESTKDQSLFRDVLDVIGSFETKVVAGALGEPLESIARLVGQEEIAEEIRDFRDRPSANVDDSTIKKAALGVTDFIGYAVGMGGSVMATGAGSLALGRYATGIPKVTHLASAGNIARATKGTSSFATRMLNSAGLSSFVGSVIYDGVSTLGMGEKYLNEETLIGSGLVDMAAEAATDKFGVQLFDENTKDMQDRYRELNNLTKFGVHVASSELLGLAVGQLMKGLAKTGKAIRSTTGENINRTAPSATGVTPPDQNKVDQMAQEMKNLKSLLGQAQQVEADELMSKISQTFQKAWDMGSATADDVKNDFEVIFEMYKDYPEKIVERVFPEGKVNYAVSRDQLAGSIRKKLAESISQAVPPQVMTQVLPAVMNEYKSGNLRPLSILTTDGKVTEESNFSTAINKAYSVGGTAVRQPNGKYKVMVPDVNPLLLDIASSYQHNRIQSESTQMFEKFKQNFKVSEDTTEQAMNEFGMYYGQTMKVGKDEFLVVDVRPDGLELMDVSGARSLKSYEELKVRKPLSDETKPASEPVEKAESAQTEEPKPEVLRVTQEDLNELSEKLSGVLVAEDLADNVRYTQKITKLQKDLREAYVNASDEQADEILTQFSDLVRHEEMTKRLGNKNADKLEYVESAVNKKIQGMIRQREYGKKVASAKAASEGKKKRATLNEDDPDEVFAGRKKDWDDLAQSDDLADEVGLTTQSAKAYFSNLPNDEDALAARLSTQATVFGKEFAGGKVNEIAQRVVSMGRTGLEALTKVFKKNLTTDGKIIPRMRRNEDGTFNYGRMTTGTVYTVLTKDADGKYHPHEVFTLKGKQNPTEDDFKRVILEKVVDKDGNETTIGYKYNPHFRFLDENVTLNEDGTFKRFSRVYDDVESPYPRFVEDPDGEFLLNVQNPLRIEDPFDYRFEDGSYIGKMREAFDNNFDAVEYEPGKYHVAFREQVIDPETMKPLSKDGAPGASVIRQEDIPKAQVDPVSKQAGQKAQGAVKDADAAAKVEEVENVVNRAIEEALDSRKKSGNKAASEEPIGSKTQKTPKSSEVFSFDPKKYLSEVANLKNINQNLLEGLARIHRLVGNNAKDYLFGVAKGDKLLAADIAKRGIDKISDFVQANIIDAERMMMVLSRIENPEDILSRTPDEYRVVNFEGRPHYIHSIDPGGSKARLSMITNKGTLGPEFDHKLDFGKLSKIQKAVMGMMAPVLLFSGMAESLNLTVDEELGNQPMEAGYFSSAKSLFKILMNAAALYKAASEGIRTMGSRATTFKSVAKLNIDRDVLQDLYVQYRTQGSSMDGANRLSEEAFELHDEALYKNLADPTFVQFLTESGELGLADRVMLKAGIAGDRVKNLGESMLDSLGVKSELYNLKAGKALVSFIGEGIDRRSAIANDIAKIYDTQFGEGKARDFIANLSEQEAEAITTIMQMRFDDTGMVDFSHASVQDYYARKPHMAEYHRQLMQHPEFAGYINALRAKFESDYYRFGDLLRQQEDYYYLKLRNVENQRIPYEGPKAIPDGKKSYLPNDVFQEAMAEFIADPKLTWGRFLNGVKKKDKSLYVALKKLHRSSGRTGKTLRGLVKNRRSRVIHAQKNPAYYPGMASKSKIAEWKAKRKEAIQKEFISQNKPLVNREIEAKVQAEFEKMFRDANPEKKFEGEGLNENNVKKRFEDEINGHSIDTQEEIYKFMDDMNVDPDNYTADDLVTLGFFTKEDDKYYINENFEKTFNRYSRRTSAAEDLVVDFWRTKDKETIRQIAKSIYYQDHRPLAETAHHMESKRTVNIPIEFLESDQAVMLGRYANDTAFRTVNLEHKINDISEVDDVFFDPLHKEIDKKFGANSTEAKNLKARFRNQYIQYQKDMDAMQYYDAFSQQMIRDLRTLIYTSMSRTISSYDFGQVAQTGSMMMDIKEVAYAMRALFKNKDIYKSFTKRLYAEGLVERSLGKIVDLNDINHSRNSTMPRGSAGMLVDMYENLAGVPLHDRILSKIEAMAGKDAFDASIGRDILSLNMNSMAKAMGSIAVYGNLKRMVRMGKALKMLDEAPNGVVEIDGKRYTRRSVFDILSDAGVDIDKESDLQMLRELVDDLDKALDLGTEGLSDASLVKGQGLINRVIRTSFKNYSARNPMLRGEWLQGKSPTKQATSTFMSWATNQYNLFKRQTNRIKGWKGANYGTNNNPQFIPDNINILKVHKMFRRGNIKGLKDAGFTDEMIAQYPSEAMERMFSIAASMGINVASRMGVQAVKAGIGIGIGNVNSDYREQNMQRLRKIAEVPINLDYISLDDPTFAQRLQEYDIEDVWSSAGFALDMVNFAGGEIMSAGMMGPRLGIAESVIQNENLSLPIAGITVGKVFDMAEYGIDIAQDLYEGEFNSKAAYNLGRVVHPGLQFTNKAQ